MPDLTVFLAVRPRGEVHGHFEAPPEHAEALRAAVLGALRCRVTLDPETLRRLAAEAGVPPEALARAVETLALGDGPGLEPRRNGAGSL
jgi:hypothetical protein